MAREDVAAIGDENERSDLPDSRICVGCRSSRKHEDFRHLPNDPRCIYCVETDKAQGREFDAASTCQKLIAEFLDATDTPVTAEMPRPAEVGASLLQHFGGVNSFTLEWRNQVMHAARQRPGSMATVKNFENIGRFLLQASKQEDNREIADMTTEQLEKERATQIAQMFAEAGFSQHRKSMMQMLVASLGVDPREVMPVLESHFNDSQEVSEIGVEPEMPEGQGAIQ